MPSPITSDFLALQTSLAGRYSLERELGRGGMGIVFLAHEVALDRPVALKLLPPELAVSEEVKIRFLQEARTAAKLSHPNIVPIFAVDEVDGFVFFAMAFIEGETLGERVRARGPLSDADATRMMREVAWALAYAHLQGVVHRDLKPDNILLEGGTGRAFVTDFGIAQVGAEGSLDSLGHVQGTAEFMSPEQAKGAHVDTRSDLYSLGAVGFYAVSGRFPFEDPSAAVVLGKHVTEAPLPVASRAPAVSAPLAQAIDRCLRKEPGERFADGEAIADVLAAESVADRPLPMALRVFIKHVRETSRSLTATAAFAVLFALPMVMVGIASGYLPAFVVLGVLPTLLGGVPAVFLAYPGPEGLQDGVHGGRRPPRVPTGRDASQRRVSVRRGAEDYAHRSARDAHHEGRARHGPPVPRPDLGTLAQPTRVPVGPVGRERRHGGGRSARSRAPRAT